ncbi:NUDIX hydrolase [Paenibacillus odorifer]|uniref:NUDIX hydrolase n=1 Tax=Paenibacillus odorifer TaxID=189426 RepID=UPI00096DC47B|nr:NUDIX domain-containing protein [Paenibacillus odorifer]OMD17280.1 hypothetical protein BJP50_16150 [Paenibacillus odorifer]
MDIRNSARAILMNNSGQVLLFKFKFEDVKDQKILWVTAGGGLKDNESFEEALRREIFEEIGANIDEIGPWVWTRSIVINGVKKDFISYERYYLININDSDVTLLNMTDKEKRTLKGYYWWNIEEIIKSNEVFAPPKLGDLIKDILEGNIPNQPLDIE